MNLLVWGSNQGNLLSNSAFKYITNPSLLSLPYHILSVCAS